MLGVDIGIVHIFATSDGSFIDVPVVDKDSIYFACEELCKKGESLAVEKLHKFDVPNLNLNYFQANPRYIIAALYEMATFYGIDLHYVDPRGTSSYCHSCTYPVRYKDRLISCPNCGITLDRDLNAAINIKRLALGEKLTEYPKKRRSKKKLEDYNRGKLKTVVEGILYKRGNFSS